MEIFWTVVQYLLIYCLFVWALGFAYERLCPAPVGQKRDYTFAKLAPAIPVVVILFVTYVFVANLLLFGGSLVYEGFICPDHRQ